MVGPVSVDEDTYVELEEDDERLATSLREVMQAVTQGLWPGIAMTRRAMVALRKHDALVEKEER